MKLLQTEGHHLSWQTTMIVFEVLTKELIYLEYFNDEGFLPDSSQQMVWHNEQVIDPNL